MCEKLCARENGLKKHMKSHARPKDLTCPICKREFKQTFNLNRHLALHTTNKLYSNVPIVEPAPPAEPPPPVPEPVQTIVLKTDTELRYQTIKIVQDDGSLGYVQVQVLGHLEDEEPKVEVEPALQTFQYQYEVAATRQEESPNGFVQMFEVAAKEPTERPASFQDVEIHSILQENEIQVGEIKKLQFSRVRVVEFSKFGG